MSKEPPTDIPTADEIVCGVLEKVGDALPDLQHDLIAGSHLFRNSPFELFMSVIEQGLLFRVFEVLEPLTAGRTNAFHAYLVRLLTEHKIAHLITTNFDYMFECALGEQLGDVSTFYGWQDIDKLTRELTRPSLVKLHGSILDRERQDISKATVLTTVDQIYKGSERSLLQRWASALDGKTILFLGYSGRDRLDVMRLVSYLDRSWLVWVSHTDSPALRVSGPDDSLSREVRAIAQGESPSIVVVSGRTKQFVSDFGRAIHVDPKVDVSVSVDCEARPISFRQRSWHRYFLNTRGS